MLELTDDLFLLEGELLGDGLLIDLLDTLGRVAEQRPKFGILEEDDDEQVVLREAAQVAQLPT